MVDCGYHYHRDGNEYKCHCKRLEKICGDYGWCLHNQHRWYNYFVAPIDTTLTCSSQSCSFAGIAWCHITLVSSKKYTRVNLNAYSWIIDWRQICYFLGQKKQILRCFSLLFTIFRHLNGVEILQKLICMISKEKLSDPYLIMIF